LLLKGRCSFEGGRYDFDDETTYSCRMMKNKFYEQVQAAEQGGVGNEELKALLGKGRSKKGMFEGNLEEGELEIGQSSLLTAFCRQGIL
jgi:hypothetical protein